MTDPDLQHAAASIDHLRALRVRATPDLSIGTVIEPLRRDLGKRVKHNSGIIDAWRATVPDSLRARTTVRSFRRGLLTIETPDTSTRFLVQQWLRSGGEGMVAGCAPGTVNKVVVRVTSKPTELAEMRVSRGD